MATIANLAVRVSADDIGFHATMDRLARKTISVGATLKKFGTGGVNVGGKIADQLSGGNITGALKSGIEGVQKTVSGLLKMIPEVGPALAGTFAVAVAPITAFISVAETALNIFKEGAAAIKETYFASKRLGVSTEEMAGIMEAAGGASEALEKGIYKMGQNLGDAVLGSEEAQRKFDRLGLSWQKLAGMSKRAQIGTVLDALKKTGNTAVGVKSQMDILGKSAYQLGGVIAKGNDGLKAGEARAKQYGKAFSEVDSAQVMEASKSLKVIGKVMTGIKMQAAIALAPVISGIADEFKTLGVDADMVRDVTVGALKVMSYTAAGFIQILDAIKIAWDMQEIAIGALVAGAVEGLTVLMEQAAKLPDALGGSKFRATAQDLRGTSTKLWSSLEKDRREFAERLAKPSAWTRVSRFWDGADARIDKAKKNGGRDAAAEMEAERMAEVARKVGDLQTKLDDQTAAYGRNSQIVEVSKLARQGATEAMLAGVRASIAEIDALNKITDQATNTLTIFENFRAKVEGLKAAFEAGEISAQGLEGGLAKIGDALDKSVASKAAALFQQTRRPLETFQAKLDELNEMLNAGAITWDTYARATRAANREAIKADSVFQQMRTPLEAFQDKIAELDEALEAGEMQWETYARAVNAAGQEIVKLNKAQETKLAGAAEFGSQEAYGAVNKAQAGAAQGSGIDGLREVMKQLLEVAKKDAKNNEDVARAARKGLLAPGKIG